MKSKSHSGDSSGLVYNSGSASCFRRVVVYIPCVQPLDLIVRSPLPTSAVTSGWITHCGSQFNLAAMERKSEAGLPTHSQPSGVPHPISNKNLRRYPPFRSAIPFRPSIPNIPILPFVDDGTLLRTTSTTDHMNDQIDPIIQYYCSLRGTKFRLPARLYVLRYLWMFIQPSLAG
jgi:hypothetical protein